MNRATVLLLPLAFSLSFGLADAPLAHAACTDGSGLCVNDGAGVKWKPDATLSAAQLKKEEKKRKGASARLNLVIEGGRGSVFIDGRYASTAPLSRYILEPGAHDVQVRDGARILAEGVLTVPAGVDVEISVRH
jgi:hypothetical protein